LISFQKIISIERVTFYLHISNALYTILPGWASWVGNIEHSICPHFEKLSTIYKKLFDGCGYLYSFTNQSQKY